MSYGKPKVGMKIWGVKIFPYGGRKYCQDVSHYQEIDKVGRLYFYINSESWNPIKVKILDWEQATEFRGNGYWKFYPTKEMYKELEYKKTLISQLKNEFHIKNHKKFSLEQLLSAIKYLGLRPVKMKGGEDKTC